MHVYPFEWLEDRRRLLDVMAQDLGMQFKEEAYRESRKANVSLGKLGLNIMRSVNLFTHQSVVNKTCILDVPG